MRLGMGFKKLGGASEHRKALVKNLLNSLVRYEQITTTLPKAKVLKPQADKIITLGEKDTFSNTQALISKLPDF
jgi:Ribosomal protein L17